MTSDTRLIDNYQNIPSLLNEFHTFIARVFPRISFKEWQARGHWNQNYIPYSIIKDGQIIANACVTLMKIVLNGKVLNAIQLGAIGTLPEYRKKGLARTLMNHILQKYKDRAMMFLFANETVLNFYPKFGFRPVQESLFICESNLPNPAGNAHKLNIAIPEDYKLLQKLLSGRLLLTARFGALNYESITLWYIFNFYEDNLYYLPQHDAVVIMQTLANTAQFMDVIFTKPFDLQAAVPHLITSRISTINYNFCPDQLHFQFDHEKKLDTGLYIRGDIDLPETSFRFPVTAIT